MLLSKYSILTLGKKRCKKKTYMESQKLSLYVKFQAIYTTKLEFCTLYDVKEKKML